MAQKATAVDSTFYEAWDILSLVQADRGDFTAAARAHQKAIEASGGDYWVRQFNEGLIAGRKGDLATVRKVLKELEGDPRLAQRAGLYHLLGQTDTMYALLNKAVDRRDPDILQVLFATPQMYDLKGDPRHTEILKRLGLVEKPTL
jgi:tetratricopeptide (TPR) repeat protein